MLGSTPLRAPPRATRIRLGPRTRTASLPTWQQADGGGGEAATAGPSGARAVTEVARGDLPAPGGACCPQPRGMPLRRGERRAPPRDRSGPPPWSSARGRRRPSGRPRLRRPLEGFRGRAGARDAAAGPRLARRPSTARRGSRGEATKAQRRLQGQEECSKVV
ncbi:unnamed protein product [Prorocentrum cordatum]|uniref:Uncharacterized protein n=1 Tax=Prorocentrum cordatum TaxID=2364126 RepID=A0ABN9RYZ8_9DINO|nr:unnamed protein product [Polarella glacialis]